VVQWLADRLHAKERLQQSWKKIHCEGFRDICCLCDVLLEPIKVYSTTRCWVDFLLCISQDAMLGIMQIVYINISCRTSRWIRPSHFPTNTPCSMPPLWLLPSSSTLPCSFPYPPSFSKLSLASLSLFDLLLPSQCCEAVVRTLSPDSLLSMCPNQFHLLRGTWQLMSLTFAISTTLLFVILCCHLILSNHLRHWHWKLFSFCSSALMIFHVSQPYSRTGRTKVLNRHILVLLSIPLVAHTFPSL